MKILLVTTVPETIKAFLMPLICEIREKGFEVHVATGRGCQLPALKKLGVKEYRLPLNRSISPLTDFASLCRLLWICRKEKYDLIHTHTLKASLVGQLAAILSRIRARLVTVHGTVYSDNLPWLKRKLVFVSEMIASKFANKVWVLNSEDYAFFNERIGVKSDRLDILSKCGIGVDLKEFSPNACNDEDILKLRNELGIKEGCNVVGFVGRLVKDKGVHELIEAWQQIEKEIQNVSLLIVTSKMVTERQSELVAHEKINNLKNCVVIENAHDMSQLYNCMDIIVLPSYREGFSRVVLEGAASGVPLVVSDVKGCRDGVVNGKTGLIVPARDSGALRDAIKMLLSNKDLRIFLGENARKFALERFDQDMVIHNTIQEYEKHRYDD